MPPKGKAKPAAPAAAAAAPAVQVEDLFSALHRHIQAFEYKQAAKVADQVLEAVPGDEDALRCKVVALIKADAIDRALLSIPADTTKGLQDLGFYKAYCLYRQNKLHEALECLEAQEKNSMHLQLESQILYRLGRMDVCLESYEKLRKFKIDSLDLKTNIIAALISAGRASELRDAYNFACSLIEKKQYSDAEQMLLSARRIGQETLMEDDFMDDEIENELAPIAVQLAYVQQLQGHPEEALQVYSDIVNKVADASSIAVATNNLIALKGTKEVSDSLRKLDQLVKKDDTKRHFQLANGLEFKLFARQKEAIYSNRVLLLLQASKLDQAQELVYFLSSTFPECISPVLLQAAVFVRGKNILKAEEVLGQFADRLPEKAQHALLARAQIAAAAGHAKLAAESLARIPGIQHMPATVATIVALRERAGDLVGAAAALDSAVEWWRNAMTEEGGGAATALAVLTHEAASYKLGHGREEEAARLYEELFTSQGGGDEALAGLVKTVARTDTGKAEAYEKRLRPLPGLKGIDVESLEKTSGAKLVDGTAVPRGTKAVEEAAGGGAVKDRSRKKKRKRKPRYPKGFDPANPEVHLSPKRKDKRHQVRGSQGAVVREKNDATAVAGVNPTGGSGAKPGHGGASAGKGGASAASSEPARTSGKGRKKSRS
ncbi:unnamed protein product [Spirodela intermedia]|uniref:Signal recognition particle subunit SRP72 n=1 Tax=Spirodela intermedia TaxID=51605 RepID=A0A7I8J1Y9_SPIIN|nr:unnamed protein product [Spirodela intermedia]CAA6664168.1 unnamed protein product [Spirodela intermedia]